MYVKLDQIGSKWHGLYNHDIVSDLHGLDKHGLDKHRLDKHGLDKHGLDKHGLNLILNISNRGLRLSLNLVLF